MTNDELQTLKERFAIIAKDVDKDFREGLKERYILVNGKFPFTYRGFLVKGFNVLEPKK